MHVCMMSLCDLYVDMFLSEGVLPAAAADRRPHGRVGSQHHSGAGQDTTGCQGRHLQRAGSGRELLRNRLVEVDWGGVGWHNCIPLRGIR